VTSGILAAGVDDIDTIFSHLLQISSKPLSGSCFLWTCCRIPLPHAFLDIYPEGGVAFFRRQSTSNFFYGVAHPGFDARNVSPYLEHILHSLFRDFPRQCDTSFGFPSGWGGRGNDHWGRRCAWFRSAYHLSMDGGKSPRSNCFV
jgi:hypothetical protein